MLISELCNADKRNLDPDLRRAAAVMTVPEPEPEVIGLDYVSNPWGAIGRPPLKPEDEHRNLSQDQLDYLDQALGDIPALLADLDIAMQKFDRFPAASAPVTDGSESPLQFSMSAADSKHQLARTVGAAAGLLWHRATNGLPSPFRDATDAGRWLQTQLTRLAVDPEAENIYHSITNATSHAHRTIERPPSRQFLGQCPRCHLHDLYARDDQPTVTCDCGWSSDVTAIISARVGAAEDQLFTDTQLVGAVDLQGGELTVTRVQIQRWRDRGRLPVHEQKRWSHTEGKIITVQTSRLGDVLKLAREHQARKAS